MGIALCCVLVPVSNNDAWRDLVINISLLMHFPGAHPWLLESFRYESIAGRIFEDHLWLHYLPREEFDKDPRMRGWERSCTRFEIFFSIPRYGSELKIKKCGARLVYPSDMEDMDPRIVQLITPTSPNFDDIHQHTSDGSTG